MTDECFLFATADPAKAEKCTAGQMNELQRYMTKYLAEIEKLVLCEKFGVYLSTKSEKFCAITTSLSKANKRALV